MIIYFLKHSLTGECLHDLDGNVVTFDSLFEVEEALETFTDYTICLYL